MKLTKRNYFSKKANQHFMSVSQFKSFLRCPAAAMAELRGEYEREKTTALLVGSYVDSYFEKTLKSFANQNPEIFKRDGTLKSEYIQANAIIERIERDNLFMKHLSGKKQVIMTGEICGVPFKIKIDSFRPGEAIDDLKIVKDFEPIWHEEKGRVPWFEWWEYDLQGAVYQEIVRQNTGEKLPFFLDAATKEKVTDIDVLEINQRYLDYAMETVKHNVEMFDAMKHGIIEPTRCEKCEHCKRTKVLTEPTKAEEFYF